MAKILIGLSECFDAFVAAPVVRALADRGDEVHVAWFGARAAYEQALTLGLPEVEATICDPDDATAEEFAADMCDELASGDREDGAPRVVMTTGHDRIAVALAMAADEEGLHCVRLRGGERAGVHERARRLADHAASLFCARTERQRLQLQREGVPASSVRVVGSLVAASLAGIAHEPVAGGHLWLAIEHDLTHSEYGARLAATITEAAARSSLPVRAVPTVLAADPAFDASWFDAGQREPLDQLRFAAGAAVVVTDSLGHQELAAAAGVPCVTLSSPHGTREDFVSRPGFEVAYALDDVPAAVARVLAATPPAPTVGEDPAQAVCAAIDSWHTRSPAPDALPADGDASGRTFDDDEVALVTDVLRSGTLNSTRGTYVHRFEREFAAWLGVEHAVACNSGSAAVHCAIAALGLAAGDEVITTPITDMGALTPILYEGCVPVFADVDPDSLNVTAATIEAQLTDRTKAIVVTHLFGRPAELGPILELACRRELPVVEDAAQAFGATLDGARIGTQGLISAFSLQQGKHITTGEGGVVCTRDEALARRLFLFVNKAWGYGDAKPDHYFPALNYRMTELQGAVACGQLPKLDAVVAARRAVAAGLRERLAGLAGIACPDDPPGGAHSYWKFAFRVDAGVVPGGAVALGGRMREQGIACAPRYVQKPAFECQLFRDWRAHPVTALPLGHNPRGADGDAPLFDRSDYPGAVRGLEQVVVLPINERYRPEHLDAVADAIRAAHRDLTA